MNNQQYDVIILGGGPAGLSASLYTARSNLNTLIIEKGMPGGQILTTNEIENYPGSIEGETGSSLSNRMKAQAESFGTKILQDTITEVSLKGSKKIVKGEKGIYESDALIIATGASPKLLGCTGEKEHIGMGVSYCATCDGSFFTGLEVFVVGGGNSALEEAEFLTKFAKKVNIVHRRDAFRGSKKAQEKLENNENVNIMLNATIDEIAGDGPVDRLVLRNTKSGEKTVYKADEKDGMLGVFIFVGYEPVTKIFEDAGILNEKGYIVTDEKMRTTIPGVFGAGDVRDKEFRQVITAAADGAIAAMEVSKYLQDLS